MTLYLRKEDLDWREIDDEIIALDGRESVYLSVRNSGAVLWRLLAATSTRDDLVSALVDRYGIDAGQAGSDTDEFLADLSQRGLLVS